MNIPEHCKALGLFSFCCKAYILIASTAYSLWFFNLQSDPKIKSFAVRETFNRLIVGFHISVLGLAILSAFHLAGKRKKELGWNLLFVAYALIWILFLAPLNVR